ncbi:MAG TPA: ThuA domain-containing protein [Verrucomicrobiales bacterium]|nr:ThuA domain-containing protein [Verrucomicrobiales bacterium]
MKIKSLALLVPTALAVFLFCAAPGDPKAEVSGEVHENISKALPAVTPAVPSAAHPVLVFSKTNGFRHGSIPAGAAALSMMGEATKAFSVTHTEDDSFFEAGRLREFRAVIMLNTTGEVFRPAKLPDNVKEREAALQREEVLKKSLVDFVQNGGGLAGIHSATDTYHGWKEYNDMMGGVFDGHPWHELVPVRNLRPDHPVNACFEGKGFEITDEIYQFRADTASPEDRLMLLSLAPGWEGLSKGKHANGFYPVSWVRDYGKGRVFYCSLGHRDEIYWNPVILKHYLAGIQFVVGDLEANAEPAPIPAS